MGAHLAYHQNPINKSIHFLCIPVILFGIIKLLSMIPMFGAWDASIWLIIFLSPVFLLPDVISGLCFILLMLIIRFLALEIPTGFVGVVIGIISVISAFLVQTQVGHKLFEADARDDTEENITAFRLSKNPIPLLLIFHYHMIELLMMLGYRPKLRNEIDHYTKLKTKSFT